MAQNSLILSDLSLKVCISRIPTEVNDDIIKSLLNACGPLKEWKRLMGAQGEPKPSGIAEFTDV